MVLHRDDRVARIDPATDQVAATIPADSGGPGVAAGGGGVWATDPEGSALLRLDLGANRVVARTPLSVRPVMVVAGEGAIWVRAQPAHLVVRLALEP